MNAALDLGNSRLKLLRGDRTKGAWSLASVNWDRFEKLLTPVKRIALCSVNPVFEPILMEHLGSNREVLDVRHVIAEGKLPFRVIAKGVGADRVMGVLGALRYENPPLIVFNLGTATTATILDDKQRLIGGYIVPGMELQLSALRNAFPHLPVPTKLGATTGLGKDTQRAIDAGIPMSVLGLIICTHTAVVEELQNTQVNVFVTGGHTRLVEKLMKYHGMAQIARTLPELVLEGTLSLLDKQ
ncbi:MAG: type III pantothenate kinase [Chlorobi bacterium]|nr:type III pantothenate kinase [Chlorobiota bacterium]